MKKLDDYIIDEIYQKIADALARWTTPGILEQNILILCSLIELFVIWSLWINNKLTIFSAVVVPFILCFILYLAFRSGRETKEGLAPTARIQFVFLRIFVVFDFFVFGFINILFMVYTGIEAYEIGMILRSGTEVCGLYFMACRTNPPKRREVFSGKFAPATNR